MEGDKFIRLETGKGIAFENCLEVEEKQIFPLNSVENAAIEALSGKKLEVQSLFRFLTN